MQKFEHMYTNQVSKQKPENSENKPRGLYFS